MSLESEDTIEIRTLMDWTQWCFFIWAENRKSVKLKIKSFQEIITNPPVYSHMLITRVLQGIFPLLLFGSLVLQLAVREFKSIQQTDENIFFIAPSQIRDCPKTGNPLFHVHLQPIFHFKYLEKS